MDAFKEFCEQYRKDPETGKNNFCILQAEDELAAIGMVIGASWNGARAFTSTAGPGISLMNELLGLAYYAEIPAVVVDVQRVGPSTGMPTRTQQGDMLECAYASHGDTKHILLFPANPAECFEFAVKAFDLAERFQTPVFMLSDLDIGMNDWVVPRLTWDDSLSAGSRARADAEQIWKQMREVPALSCRRRELRRGADAARRASERRVLHARLRPQQVRRLHGNSRRISGSDGSPARRSTRRRRSSCRQPMIVQRPGARFGDRHAGRLRSGRARGAGPAGRSRASLPIIMRMRGFPFDEAVERFHRASTNSASWWSRTAMRSCARC